MDAKQSILLLHQRGFGRSMIGAMLGMSYGYISKTLNKSGYRQARSRKVKSRTRNSWASMLSRCTNPNSAYYSKYGHRGIRICTRWFNFDNFLADMGERPDGKTLDRIDNDGNYEPGNCRWATAVEQAANRKGARLITYGDESMTTERWDIKVGLPIGTISERMRRGWSSEAAITTKLMVIYSNKKSEHA